MIDIIQKYINLYLNKSIIKTALWQRYTNSRLFLDVSNKVKSSLLAMALSINNFELFILVRKKAVYYSLEVQMLMSENKLIQNELKNRFDIKE